MDAPDPAVAANKTKGGNSAFHNFNNDFAHIQDPNERRRKALAEIDKASFGWYHVRACVVAGVGFFTDSYDVRIAALRINAWLSDNDESRSLQSTWSLLCSVWFSGVETKV